MLPAEEDSLNNILEKIPSTKVAALVFRTVPVKYVKSVDSVEGARVYGGRYNPPCNLASKCDVPDRGFGFLYTASNPMTCLFECGHILRGLGEDEFQMVSVEPTLLVTFKAEADHVLDLRNTESQSALGLTIEDLTEMDHRSDVNDSGNLTQLQRLGVAAYKTGRSGILTPSRFSDIIPSYCFDFLPYEVRPVVQDVSKVLSRISIG